jgi:hypothetical protein
MGDKVDPLEVLPVLQQSCDEFLRAHLASEVLPSFFRRIKLRGDVRGFHCVDLPQNL